MNPSETHWLARLRPQGLLARWALLSAVVLILIPIVGWIAWSGHGSQGLTGALIAAAVCWTGSSIALVLSCLANGSSASASTNISSNNALAGMLGGMLFRMALPLAVGGLLNDRYPDLREAELLIWLAAFYLVTLPVETWLSLPLVGKRATSPGHSPSPAGASMTPNS